MKNERLSHRLWVTDADNTLWDTNAVFRDAQISLLRSVEGLLGAHAATDDSLAYVRDVDQAIASLHHRGLRYPGGLLALGLSLRLAGMASEEAALSALQAGVSEQLAEVTQSYYMALQATPQLREGVREGMRFLAEHQFIIVVATEGPKERVEAHLTQHQLSPYVSDCIEAPKSPEFFARLAKLYGASEPWMIGDQLDRDVLPAKKAGYKTLYFAGGFQPRWHKSEHAQEAMFYCENYLAAAQSAVACLLGGHPSPK